MQLKKNDILEVIENDIEGVGKITAERLQDWREYFKGKMIGDDGEIRLEPRESWYEIPQGSKLIVTRARVARGMVGVINPESGIEMRVYRYEIERATRVLR